MKILIITLAFIFSWITPVSADHCMPTMTFTMQLLMWGEVKVESEIRPSKKDPDVEFTWELWVNPMTDKWSLVFNVAGSTCMGTYGEKAGGKTITDILDGPGI